MCFTSLLVRWRFTDSTCSFQRFLSFESFIYWRFVKPYQINLHTITQSLHHCFGFSRSVHLSGLLMKTLRMILLCSPLMSSSFEYSNIGTYFGCLVCWMVFQGLSFFFFFCYLGFLKVRLFFHEETVFWVSAVFFVTLSRWPDRYVVTSFTLDSFDSHLDHLIRGKRASICYLEVHLVLSVSLFVVKSVRIV